MSWMMEQSGKQCQCERRKGKLRRQMHRETEKDTHGERKRRVRMHLSSGRLQNIWPSDRVFFVKHRCFRDV